MMPICIPYSYKGKHRIMSQISALSLLRAKMLNYSVSYIHTHVQTNKQICLHTHKHACTHNRLHAEMLNAVMLLGCWDLKAQKQINVGSVSKTLY